MGGGERERDAVYLKTKAPATPQSAITHQLRCKSPMYLESVYVCECVCASLHACTSKPGANKQHYLVHMLRTVLKLSYNRLGLVQNEGTQCA